MAGVIENRGPQLLAVDYTFLLIAVITFAMRCYVRIFMVKNFGRDDWAMLGATIIFILYCSCSISGIHFGTGHHKVDLSDENYAQAAQFWWFCYLTYCWTMILAKASIALFLLRVAVRRAHIWIIYGAMAITVVTCLAFFFVLIFQCSPVSYFWDKYTQTGVCIPDDVVSGLGYLYSACSIITDFTFALLPAWIISQLKMKTRTKVALIPLMAMGCVASSAVAVRCAYFSRLRDPDFLFSTVDVAVWSTIEQGLAISAGSLATLRPLLKQIGYKLGVTTRPSGPGYPSYGKMGTPLGGGSHMGPSRRRGSQSANDALNLDTFTTFSTKCEAGGTNQSSIREQPLPGGISMGRTYEISSEYMDPAAKKSVTKSEKKSKRLSSPFNKATWQQRTESDSESIEALQTESSSEGIEGNKHAVPRSFLSVDENRRK
ncbi:hypothetical protein F4821DRAFT_183194 [Hypoxylon rubiginosum]|uniref:Uncharacterized protein n=1 Tax=Hypoxylon rubiginosum TaxID=110542 RepID=A0ACC0CTN7_9PEZI|nr:hypothetical protein F4821DRAFT_183194 [Hypoxylon rubiginosum]